MNSAEQILAKELDAMAAAMPAPEAAKPVFAVFFHAIGKAEVVRVKGTFTTRRRAQASADKKSMAYGSYAYTVRQVAS